jgi:hypothetical protein
VDQKDLPDLVHQAVVEYKEEVEVLELLLLEIHIQDQ